MQASNINISSWRPPEGLVRDVNNVKLYYIERVAAGRNIIE
jgi:hypothetical protein